MTTSRFNFRVWDGERMWADAQGHIDWYAYMKEDKYTLMQSTGLVDKNGMEIFEGDLVESDYTGAISVIKFGEFRIHDDNHKDTVVGFYFDGNHQVCPFGRDIDGATEFYKVIGNIHENPELINE